MSPLRFASVLLAVACSAPAQLSTALDLNTRGNQASEAGNSEEAIRLYRESLAIWAASGEQYDAHRAGTLLNLAIVISATGDRPAAASLMVEALALHRKTLGIEHHRTLSNMNLLASNYLMIGEVDRAAALLDEALPVERAHFPEDIQTARTLEAMANVLVRRGKSVQAVAPAEEALTIAIKATGEDSLDTALAYSNVAEALRSSGHAERALPLFRKARASYERVLGPDHARVSTLLSQEGLIMLEDGKLAIAEQLLTRAISSLERACPLCAVEQAIAENNLAVLRIRQKRFQEAGALLTHVVELRDKFTSAPGAELAASLQLLAAVRQKQKLFEDADRLNRRAATILSYR